MRKVRWLGVLVLAVTVALVANGPPARTQDGPVVAGICDGVICGPSGAFSPATFPTLTPIDWGAFPAARARDYAPAEGARAWYVGLGGSDDGAGTQAEPLATIEAAVLAAGAGDVIWVADGDYVIGAPGDYEALILEVPGVTLAAEHSGGARLVPHSGEDSAAIAMTVKADGVTVDGFLIANFREAGIEFGRTNGPQRGAVLQHLRIDHCGEGIRAAYGGNGQPIVDGLLVYDVWLLDNTVIGLQCGEGPCNNLRLEALRIEMAGGDTGDSGADALALESGENIVVFNVEISGAAGDGIDLKTSTAAVANVWVHDIGRNGIKIWHGGDIINALVVNTGADAAIVTEAGVYRLLNVLVARHNWGDSAYAMSAAYDSSDQLGRVEIINSVFYQNAGAVWISSAMALDVQNSVFFGSGNGQELEWRDLTVGENAQPVSALEAAGGGSGNLGFIDPLFIDPEMSNFEFGDGSPLQDAGTDAVPLPGFDLYGRPRVVGAAVDLGPWERQR